MRIPHRSRVPAGRGERLLRLGRLAGGLAAGGLVEGARRLAGRAPAVGHVLMTGPNARRLVRHLSSLRGAAMKVGQLVSLEADDLLPPEVAEALATLRDAGHAMPAAQLREAMCDALGPDWEKRFRRFDPEPIAAASIGQVHAATALDGRELAIKVQYPGVARSIDSDVDNLAAALRLARVLPGDLDFGPLCETAKRQLREEADYEAEAGHLRRYGALLADEPGVAVPRVHADLSSRTVLAMDRLLGTPLEDACGKEHPDSLRDRIGSLLLRLALREFFEFRFLQSDPNLANYLLLPDGRVGLLDLGAGQEVSEALATGYARLFAAALEGDREGLRRAAGRIGFLAPSDPPRGAEALLDVIALATEPFRHRGRYDFGRTDLAARTRDASLALMFEHGFLRPPPPETLFLQRKLGGTLLLCMRLRARVDARALLEDVLARAGAGRGRRAARRPRAGQG